MKVNQSTPEVFLKEGKILIYEYWEKKNLEQIMKLCNIGTLFAFILVSIGVIVLRKTMASVERKFKCPWVPVLPVISALACVYLMSALSLVTWITFVIWLLIGIVIYFLYGRHHSVLQNEKTQL